MRRSAWTTGVAMLAALSLGVAACGGSDSGDDGGDTPTGQATPPAQAKTGGKLEVLWAGDVDFIDCGRTYSQMGSFICFSTQKPLYSYKPDDPVTMQPDLAASLPEVSEDGKTVTIKIKPGVKYSKPYDKVVTSADVKYAIERGFFSSVANGFTTSYYGDLEGAKVGADPGTKIKGIETPDDTTLVLKFKRPVGGVMAAGALAYPATAPVPEEYAEKFDAEPQSTYGENQLSTGPYMIENDASGKSIGYDPGKRIHLVRNDNWDKSLDYKPAHLDEIDNLEGNDDVGIASRKILEGQSMIAGDFTPLPENLKSALDNTPDQIKLAPPVGGRWIALNTTIKPFDDANIRKAVSAGMDRNALLLTRGGKTVGDMATHFLPPGTAGFEEAGGAEGTGVDFLSADGAPLPDVSAKYFKAAGFASGKYEGTEKLLMVGSNAGVAAKTAEVAKESLTNMGFNVQLRLVEPQIMYTRYCNVPKADVAICPNVGWIRDFADGQTMLSPTFAGKNILPEGNSNWPQLNDEAINAKIDEAEIAPVDQRAQLWGEVDKMVTATAAAIPWIWDKQALIQSKNVAGVIAENNSQWDLAWTSLK
ncbi:ABC transporter substrate-binding protein [Solirubrobacter phytolaccae]|uniref:ABC transporter substrate-binding protein n=1 Tax=Solirubrobacter phytolaccae TaxID=1404360 RepID=A0A9X3N7Z6_9ACTN|nr:ABC transporter substrate-binding protein [Solirubrobacter phytolaccae]MDA0181600.1 ABC transporter substrate-binding protein [Solirubrobacter phytolaccae]